MKRWLLYILISISFLPFCSCYRDYQIKDKDFSPRIMLHSLVQADSLLNIFVSKTWLIGQASVDTLPEATVSLFVNGEPEDYMTAIPHSGDHLRLLVEAEGLPAVQATTVVPYRVKIDSLFCQRIDKNEMDIQVELTFQDPVGVPNYYGLGFYAVPYNSYGSFFVIDASKEPLFAYLDSYGILDDVVRSNSYYYRGYLIPFSGQSIDGQRYTLRVTMAINQFFWSDMDDIKICLYSFSESYYIYLLSLLRSGINVLSDYGLADPNQLYTNVENGLGIFASCQVDTVHLSLNPNRSYICTVQYH